MTDIIGGEAATETPPGGEAPQAAAAGTNVERPAWAPEKFWDGEKGELRTEDMATSYANLQKLIGSKVGELGAASKRQLVDALPEEMKALYGADLRAALAEDQEFLAPLIEKALADKLPQAPEAYMAPEGADIDIEHPAFARASEIAKSAGLSQEAFSELVGVAIDLLSPYEGPLSYDTAALKQAIGPDVERRAATVGAHVRGVLGEEVGNTLLRAAVHPDAFLALEKLVHASSEKPLPLAGEGVGQEVLTEAQLKHEMTDPRYWNPAKRDPSFVERITRGFQKLAGDRL